MTNSLKSLSEIAKKIEEKVQSSPERIISDVLKAELPKNMRTLEVSLTGNRARITAATNIKNYCLIKQDDLLIKCNEALTESDLALRLTRLV